MQTLSEFLKEDKNQSIVMDVVIRMLRQRHEWGNHGLFAKIGNSLGFSPAYVGRVFKQKNPFTDKFVEGMAVYLGKSVNYLRGGQTGVLERLIEGLKTGGVSPDGFNIRLSVIYNNGDVRDYWRELLCGTFPQEETETEFTAKVTELVNMFGLSCGDWVLSGRVVKPPVTDPIDPGSYAEILFKIRCFADLREMVADLLKKDYPELL